VFYSYTAEGDFDGRGEATEATQLTTADSFTSTNTVQFFDADGICSSPAAAGDSNAVLNNPAKQDSTLTNYGLARSIRTKPAIFLQLGKKEIGNTDHLLR